MGGLGDLVADPIAEHVAVIMIIVVTILVINVIRGIIITILEDLVVILAEVVTSEVVTAITEIVTVEVDTQIAIHVLALIQVLVGDLATNAITLVDGGEMELTAPILGKHLHLPPLQIIMPVVLLTLVMPKIFEFAFIIFLVQTYQLK